MLLLTVDADFAYANALKNMLLGIADLLAATGRLGGRSPLALGLLAGGVVGPSVTRRVPGNVIRILVGLAGLGLAVKLWIAPS